MIYTGLVSISFRKLNTDEIIEITSKAGLQGIEWGGDVHVPHGDIETAQKVRKATLEAGLKVSSYGSYYRVGTYESPEETFKQVLKTASVLEAPTIRVWAGNLSSESADEEYWNKIVAESRYIADLAKEQGITVSYEYHGNTLTDTTESALRLLQEVNHANIFSYWQPPVDLSFEDRMKGLKTVKPWLTHVHAFHWKDRERLAFHEGEGDWTQYLNEITTVPGDRYALLEFVRNDSIDQFFQDAETLKGLVAKL